MNELKLLHVYYMPNDLKPGILYVSLEFKIAGHLCPCGCGNKIMTPIGANGWRFVESDKKPTLTPSLGNWQLPCRSHYWITDGIIEWSYQWTDEEISAGYRAEYERTELYYKKREKFKRPLVTRLLNRIIEYMRRVLL